MSRMRDALVEIKDLTVSFPIKSGYFQKTVGQIKAVDQIDLTIYRGETLGLVGESGCGKTTLGRALVRLNVPAAGEIFYQDQDILDRSNQKHADLYRDFQMVFQDPYSSLNPRQTVRRMLMELLTVQMGLNKKDAAARISELMHQVGLTTQFCERYPHEFSGGQRQRIAIARSLAMKPTFLICDEAVSALDVSIQSQIINLLIDLKADYPDLTYLFITHALNVVEHISDRVAVMYLGKIVELAPTRLLFAKPHHPYTHALLSAVPKFGGDAAEAERIILTGEVPSAANIPPGCRFHTRCYRAQEICRREQPELAETDDGCYCACFFPVVSHAGESTDHKSSENVSHIIETKQD